MAGLPFKRGVWAFAIAGNIAPRVGRIARVAS